MTDPICAAAGAMERYCDERGIPMPSPGLARALAEVAAPVLAAAERAKLPVIDTPQTIPAEWIKAANDHYSMHGAGLICNILAGVAPLIRAAERERIAQLAERARATYPEYHPGCRLGERDMPFADLIRTPEGDPDA